MHAILTLTLMHDRHLASVTTQLSTTEAFHWHQSVLQFNNKLSGPVEPSDRDALWATAMCLGIISFFYVDARFPEEAWPLKEPSDTDLSWLKMTDGKKYVWKAIGPPTLQCIFDKPLPGLKTFFPPVKAGLETLPIELVSLCGLDTVSNGNANPYSHVAISLAQIFSLNSMMPIIFSFLALINTIEPEFKYLLQIKDPRALLLLAYYYAKICQYPHWWLSRRAWLEGQSICFYLDFLCPDNFDVQRLLLFPVSVFSEFLG